MKKLIILFIFFTLKISSQDLGIKTIYLNKDVTTHFLSKVHIDKIDISTKKVVGKLQNKKIVAIKPINDDDLDLGILSLIGQDYFIQFRLKYTNNLDYADTKVQIGSSEDNYFLHPDFNMTNLDIHSVATKIENLKPKYRNTSSKKNMMIIKLNNIIVKDKLIFIDYSIVNKTNLLYEVSDVKYMVDDKKITKNNNNQRILVEPRYTYNTKTTFKKNYRNIVCFDKLTFPDNKVFIIELSEKQISGRTTRLVLNYLDVLNADSI